MDNLGEISISLLFVFVKGIFIVHVSPLYPQNRKFYLSEFTGKFILLLFLPTDFPTIATEEMHRFVKAHGYFLEMDCELAAISVNTHYDHLAYYSLSKKRGGLGTECRFPLISDPNAYISEKYGMYDRECNCCYRGSVLIDPYGIVKNVTYYGSAVARNVTAFYNLVKLSSWTKQYLHLRTYIL